MGVSENLKRGVTEIVLLALLSQQDMYGYEMAQAMREQTLAHRFSRKCNSPFLVVGIPLPSCRFASSHLPQGDGFGSGGKLSGIAIRRPLGGAVAAGD